MGVGKCFEALNWVDDLNTVNTFSFGATIGLLSEASVTIREAWNKEPNNTTPCSFYLEQSDVGEDQNLLEQEPRTKIKWRFLEYS